MIYKNIFIALLLRLSVSFNISPKLWINTRRSTGGTSPCVIKVIGVGGGGGNAVMRMIETGVTGVEFVVVNTDAQALSRFKNVAQIVNIGKEVTRGLGAGGIPENGRQAAEESRQELFNVVAGSDLVFVTAGMGGGTGSGAAPIVAEVAREAGALTVGVVTKPFGFEGRRRMTQALQAINNLREVVDTLIIVSNDRLLQIIPENTPLQKAFSVADDVLRQGVVGISEIIIRPGLINVDFADVRTIMGAAGTALMGIGRGSGKTRATEAAAAAISSPLLDFPIENAKGVVFNIVGGNDLTLQEINAAAEVIYEAVDVNANIIFGALVDDSMSGEIAITVIATGFPMQDAVHQPPAEAMTVGQAMRSAGRELPPVSSPPQGTTRERPGLVQPSTTRERPGLAQPSVPVQRREREREREPVEEMELPPTPVTPPRRVSRPQPVEDDPNLPNFLDKLRRKGR